MDETPIQINWTKSTLNLCKLVPTLVTIRTIFSKGLGLPRYESTPVGVDNCAQNFTHLSRRIHVGLNPSLEYFIAISSKEIWSSQTFVKIFRIMLFNYNRLYEEWLERKEDEIHHTLREMENITLYVLILIVMTVTDFYSLFFEIFLLVFFCNFCFTLKAGSISSVNLSKCDAKYNALEYTIYY